MSDGAVLLNISEMIDLAIGTPEVGVVDFNMLQTVLHCLAQQLRVLGKNVEVRGSLASIQPPRDNVQTIAITEYAVDTDKTTKMDIAAPPPPPAEETILVVERVKKSDSASTAQSPGRGGSPLPHGTQAVQGSHGGAGARPPAGSHAPGYTPSIEKLSLVTNSRFNVLENTVEDLKNRVYGSMPKNEDILEEVRSQTNIKAISDLWTSLNVQSRLDAAESGISKLSSLVQDLINETTQLLPASQADLTEKFTAAAAEAGLSATGGGGPAGVSPSGTGGMPAAGAASKTGASPARGATSGTSTPHAKGAASGTGGTPAGGPGFKTGGGHGVGGGPANAAEVAKIQRNVDRMRGDLDHLTKTFYDTMKEIQPGLELPPPTVTGQSSASDRDTAGKTLSQTGTYGGGSGADGVGGDTSGGSGTTAGVAGGVPAPGAEGAQAPGGGGGAAGAGVGGAESSAGAPGVEPIERPHVHKHHGSLEGLAERVNSLEKRLKECCDKLGESDNVLREQLGAFQDQLEYVVKQVANLSGGGGGLAGALSPDLVKDLQGLMQLFQTVQDMQEQLKKVHETALQLAAEKEDRQSHVNALLEQIELLKTIKLDREDMAEAMAEKADLRMLARKVSHDQFEMACDGLSRGLEHALGKLNMQESLWQQALDDIQREIETKLDKMELSPVKDFFNDKLKQLQENLKQMASLRREAEAAGTKRKLLRDVNCISCDAKAVMAMEAPAALPVSKPLPATLSMKPYLSYELDAIRKTQASNLPQRNMHDWENIDKQMTQSKQPIKVRSEAHKHICNRYCGGSHTTTTPAQRVARLGHFIKQWGPDVLPLSSGLAAGDDGRMYRVTPSEAANVGTGGEAVDTTCTPKSPTKKPELPKPEKPTIVNAECKCLEAPGRPSGSK